MRVLSAVYARRETAFHGRIQALSFDLLRWLSVPLLSSILLTGIHRDSLLCDWGIAEMKSRGDLPGLHASFSTASTGRALPQPYIDLLTEVLLHREYVLLDGASSTAGDVFGHNSRWFKHTEASPSSSRITALASSEPGALFHVESSAPSSLISFVPLALPPQLARFRQTPAFVRLLTLSFLHSLGCMCMTVPTDDRMGVGVNSHARSSAVAAAAQTPSQAWASALLARIFCRVLEVATSPSMCLPDEELSSAALSRDAAGETEIDTTLSVSAESKTSGARAPLYHLPMPNSCQHRILLRAWQALSALSVFLPCFSPGIWTRVRPRLWSAFAAPQLADVRHFLDLVAVQVLRLWPAESAPALIDVLRSFNAPTQTLISALSVAGFFLLNSESVEKFGQDAQILGRVRRELLAAVVPYLTSNAAYCRGVAQYVVFEYLTKEEEKGSALPIAQRETGPEAHDHSKYNWDSDSGQPMHPTRTSTPGLQDRSREIGTAILRGLYMQLSEAKECRKLREKCGEVFRLWQPDLMASLGAFLPAVPHSKESDLRDSGETRRK